MTNLLTIPFKRTYELNVKDGVTQYLQEREGRNPAQFRDDILRWHDLRQNAVVPTVHVNRVDPALMYHAQLVSILTKLPNDIGLGIAYNTAFDPEAIPITLRNLAFERACVIFNIGALYSQLAGKEDRMQDEGIKRVIKYNQHAAGVFDYLLGILPTLAYSPNEEQLPPDLTESFIKTLRFLSIAQAQESTWQFARGQNRGNSILAKLAQSASKFYSSAYDYGTEPLVRHLFPPPFLAQINAKALHFAAVAQYRKSMDDLERSLYGVQVARLHEALSSSKKAFDAARYGKASNAVIGDIQSMLDMLKKEAISAERDNDLIYHKDVPPSSELESVSPADMAKPDVPAGLLHMNGYLEKPLFRGLIGWGTREAINIYNDRKAKLVDENIVNVIQKIKGNARDELRTRHLPASLEALQKPVGIPQSLLNRAEDLKREDGVQKIETMFNDIDILRDQVRELLEQAMTILDEECEEDDRLRDSDYEEELEAHPLSQDANAPFIQQADKLNAEIAAAKERDNHVQKLWDDWEDSIKLLLASEDEISQSIPASHASPGRMNPDTRKYSQALRGCLEELDRVHEQCDDLVYRARLLQEADDIETKVIQEAEGLSQLTVIRPALFEDLLDKELSKYDRFLRPVKDLQETHADILERISIQNELFLNSRKEDPEIRKREQALQNLDVAFQKYEEIVEELENGHKTYNSIMQQVTRFDETCRIFFRERSLQAHSIITQARSSQSWSVVSSSQQTVPSGPSSQEVSAPPTQSQPSESAVAASRFVFPPPPGAVPPAGMQMQFPPPDSDDWEPMQLPPPPPQKQPTRATNERRAVLG
ncbi:pH-response regulator [Flagelloscypha sp. PMI_526]|nr:pH-response regulator [Flagelloscypha sp. PMI_526]